MFLWYYKMHLAMVITMLLLKLPHNVYAFVVHDQFHGYLLASDFADLVFCICRMRVQSWADHHRARRIVARAWTVVVAAFIGMQIDELRSNATNTERCGWYLNLFSWLVPQASLILLSIFAVAFGIVHWSCCMSSAHRGVLTIALLTISPTAGWLCWQTCEPDWNLLITFDSAVAFGCLLGHLHEASLRMSFTQQNLSQEVAGTLKLEQVRCEKERLSYELRLATHRNAQLSSALQQSRGSCSSSSKSSSSSRAKPAAQFDDERESATSTADGSLGAEFASLPKSPSLTPSLGVRRRMGAAAKGYPSSEESLSPTAEPWCKPLSDMHVDDSPTQRSPTTLGPTLSKQLVERLDASLASLQWVSG